MTEKYLQQNHLQIESPSVQNGNGPDLWTLANAARSIQVQQHLSEEDLESLLREMLDAATFGALTVRNPQTNEAYRPEIVSEFYDLVSSDDVNLWFDDVDHHFRWFIDGLPSMLCTDEPAVEEPESPKKLPKSVNLIEADNEAKSSRKRLTWTDVAWDYILVVFKEGQFSTAKSLYQALEKRAGTGNSPFEKGTGPNIHTLYVREASQRLTLKTFQNHWPKIQAKQ